MNVKGGHNHPVNIKRNKPLTRSVRKRQHGESNMKVEVLDDVQYQDYIIEEDEEIND